MKKIWVVVADEAIARIMRWPEAGNELEAVEEMTDPEAHLSNTELQRDAHGRRSNSSTSQGGRQNTPHALRGPSTITTSSGPDEEHLEAHGFAREVAERLAMAQQQGEFDELRIAAAPRFLGLLRKYMSPNVAAAVTQELDKQLTHDSHRELTQRLFPAASPSQG